jgi:hypothetical protein
MSERRLLTPDELSAILAETKDKVAKRRHHFWWRLYYKIRFELIGKRQVDSFIKRFENQKP